MRAPTCAVVSTLADQSLALSSRCSSVIPSPASRGGRRQTRSKPTRQSVAVADGLCRLGGHVRAGEQPRQWLMGSQPTSVTLLSSASAPVPRAASRVLLVALEGVEECAFTEPVPCDRLHA